MTKRESRKAIQLVLGKFHISLILFAPKGGYKKVIDDYFSVNYVELQEISTRIQVNKLKRDDFVDTLIISCYQYLIDSEVKVLLDVLNGRLKNIVINWINKQVIWRGTDFKKDFIYEDNISIDEETWFDIEDMIEDDEVVMDAEYRHQDKMSHIMSAIESLKFIDYKLYYLVFVDGYDNSGKLSRHTGIPRVTCWMMIRDLKEKLKNGYVD